MHDKINYGNEVNIKYNDFCCSFNYIKINLVICLYTYADIIFYNWDTFSQQKFETSLLITYGFSDHKLFSTSWNKQVRLLLSNTANFPPTEIMMHGLCNTRITQPRSDLILTNLLQPTIVLDFNCDTC